MTPHEIVIRDLLAAWPATRRHGFGRSVRVALDAGDNFQPPRFIPDLFLIDEANRNVVAFEVEDTNGLTPEKIGLYCDYWWAIDGLDWGLSLVIVHVDGRPSIGLDVGELALTRLADEPSIGSIYGDWHDLAALLKRQTNSGLPPGSPPGE